MIDAPMSEATVKIMRRRTLPKTVSGGNFLSYLLPSFILFTLGSIFHFLAYSNLEALAVGITFLLLGGVILRITRLGGLYELKAFLLIFSICWFWAGVAAIYAAFFNDTGQLDSDAWSFYTLASKKASGLTIEELSVMTEGSAAVALWRAVYDLFASFGFDKGRYIGITVNVFLVSVTGVIAVKIVKEVIGHDAARLNRLIFLFSLCGLFWLFAAIHLRDAAVLFAVTSLVYFWVRYLARPQITNLIWLVVASLTAFAFLGFLRHEFLFVPLAMLGAGSAPIWFDSSTRGARRIWIYAVALLVISVFSYGFLTLEFEIVNTLTSSYEGYRDPDATSLGNQFIVNAPLPLRLTLGSAYLYIFPIPFWGGFQFESAYSLFKSFNAIYMYVVTPLFSLAMLRIARRKVLRTPPVIFLLIVVIGFTAAIAGTSLETRHFGAFLVPILVLATLPDLTNRQDKAAFRILVLIFVSLMMSAHFLWALLKFL